MNTEKWLKCFSLSISLTVLIYGLISSISREDIPNIIFVSFIFGMFAGAAAVKHIWKIDDAAARRLGIEYFGKGRGEKVAAARAPLIGLLLLMVAFALISMQDGFDPFDRAILVLIGLISFGFLIRLRIVINREEKNEHPT